MLIKFQLEGLKEESSWGTWVDEMIRLQWLLNNWACE